ncbi:MAG: MarR family transcriptional regulator [Rhodobacteraceae bacterium]|nr:MarR family transcriptional regulator [Paracoccaceae bacterium]
MDDFDLQNFLPYLLNQAAEATSREFQQYYRDRYDLLRTDWRVLFHLGRYGAMTASDVGARANVHKTKISRAVQRLEGKRMLLRAQDTADRRRETLTLSPLGQRAFADLERQARDYDARLLTGLSGEDGEKLRRQLRALAAQKTS